MAVEVAAAGAVTVPVTTAAEIVAVVLTMMLMGVAAVPAAADEEKMAVEVAGAGAARVPVTTASETAAPALVVVDMKMVGVIDLLLLLRCKLLNQSSPNRLLNLTNPPCRSHF